MASKSPSSGHIGPSALAATLSVPRQRKKNAPAWQYHPRSDHHSKVICLLMALDLLLSSEKMRRHVAEGKVSCGINHEMIDNKTKRKKKFDLVFSRAKEGAPERPAKTLKQLLKEYGVVLSPEQQARVDALPDPPVREVQANGVYVAFEAKACMTEYGKARPRLHDELNSSHPAIHGESESAVAVGFVMLNTAPSFVSPLINPDGADSPSCRVSMHKQPQAYLSVIDKIHELQCRSGLHDFGFDALGIVLLQCRNDGSPVTLDEKPQEVGATYTYDYMITRAAGRYEHYVNL